ncbi:MAG: hypothetical protein ACREE6_10685 [Limisphaerales bacterium]
MEGIIQGLLVTASAALLIGCTGSEAILRPTPSINYQLTSDKALDKGTVVFKCVDRTLTETSQNGEGPLDTPADPKGCLYEYVEISNIGHLLKWDTDPKRTDEKAFVTLTLSVTRQNCRTFLARMFANREGISFWQKVLNNFANIGSGASAFANPVAAAAISGANVAYSHFQDAATQTYYQYAQSAFETAIISSMSADEQTITNKLDDPTTSYPIMTAIADLDAYGRTCSVEGGLNQLNNAVQANKNNIPGVLPPTPPNPPSLDQMSLQE